MSLLVRVSVVGVRAAYAVLRLLPERPQVTILSRQSDHVTPDLQAIAQAVAAADPSLKVVVRCRMLQLVGESFDVSHARIRQVLLDDLLAGAEGLPIGVQCVGGFGDEATLFRLAAQLEQAAPWIERMPAEPAAH